MEAKYNIYSGVECACVLISAYIKSWSSAEYILKTQNNCKSLSKKNIYHSKISLCICLVYTKLTFHVFLQLSPLKIRQLWFFHHNCQWKFPGIKCHQKPETLREESMINLVLPFSRFWVSLLTGAEWDVHKPPLATGCLLDAIFVSCYYASLHTAD